MSGFNVRPGVYVVPELGTINAYKELDNDVLVALYLNRRFPFITLNPEGVSVLKKAKLSNQQVSSLILQSRSEEEIDLLLKVKTNKILKNIADIRKAAIEKQS